MVPRPVTQDPGYQAFIRKLNSEPVDASLLHLISLLKRRQINPQHGYAFATVRMLAHSLHRCGSSDPVLVINRIKADGKRLMEANPKQIIVGNIVRRVLGIIRDEIDELRKEGHLPPLGEISRPPTPQMATTILIAPSPLRHVETESDADDSLEGTPHSSQTEAVEKFLSQLSIPKSKTRPSIASLPSLPPVSMFDLLAYPEPQSPATESPTDSLQDNGEPQKPKDLLKESLSATNEFMDELDQADDQIASYALDHIHSNEVILTFSASETVQTFLLKAAAKRKFTVIHVEAHPNHHKQTHATAVGLTPGDLEPDTFQKSLTSLGIQVMVVPDSAVFAIMSRVNKVVLSTHSVLINGGLIADSGTGLVANAARVHKIPTVVLCSVYKLSPIYPFDPDSLVEYGDPAVVLGSNDLDLVGKIDVSNSLTEYVSPDLVDLYITNLGAHAPTYLARVISDHYRSEDINL